jgi:methionine synthase II (cobalamin-independent)
MAGFFDSLSLFLDPLTKKSTKKSQIELMNQSFDAYRDEISSKQAFGGIQLDEPLIQIEKARAESRKQLKASQGNLLTAGLGLGASIFGKLI